MIGSKLYTPNNLTFVFRQIQNLHLNYKTHIRSKFYFASSFNNKFTNIHVKDNSLMCRLNKYLLRHFISGSSVLRDSDSSVVESSVDSEESYLDEVSKQLYKHPGVGHNVFIVQPRVKFGPAMVDKPRSQLKLDEAIALVNTLPDWKVLEKVVCPTTNIKTPLLFGKGNLENLKSMVRSNPQISAVLVGIDILTSLQNTKLEACFRVPVFDRYQLILQIFHDHAQTKEAKLQLALAEIPYLKIKLCSFSHTWDSSKFLGIGHVGGDGETNMEIRKKLLNERELKLKKSLEKIKNQRDFLRRSEMRNDIPIIAVVGYTNCGKTTLIKSLTNDSRLLPEDKLFATLDVTLHQGYLPSNQKVLFIDTVGFISDVPTSLIQSFKSTLEEINLADLVIHIRDISHPDTEAQKTTVLATLQSLNLPQKLLDSIVEVKNKIDLVENPKIIEDSDAIHISATDGTGLPNLLEVVEQALFENTGHNVSLIRIPNGGPEYSWLLREAAMRDAMADSTDPNYLIMEVVISSANLAKFKHMFGDLTVSLDSIS